MSQPQVHAAIADPDSVTHFICPDGPTRAGVPDATHHLVPKRAGQVAGQPAWEETCEYCHKSAKTLRTELGLTP